MPLNIFLTALRQTYERMFQYSPNVQRSKSEREWTTQSALVLLHCLRSLFVAWFLFISDAKRSRQETFVLSATCQTWCHYWQVFVKTVVWDFFQSCSGEDQDPLLSADVYCKASQTVDCNNEWKKSAIASCKIQCKVQQELSLKPETQSVFADVAEKHSFWWSTTIGVREGENWKTSQSLVRLFKPTQTEFSGLWNVASMLSVKSP